MRKKILPYLLLTPAIVVYVTFSLIPLAGVFRLSLFRTNFIKTRWVGLDHYVRLFTDKEFLGALYNSALYVILGVPVHLALAVGVALLISNTTERWQNFAKTFCYLPSFIGVIILSATWAWIWDADAGIINQMLGERVLWFSSRWLSIPPIVIAATVTNWGGSLVIFSAVLKGVPRSSIDAAMVDGAKWWQIKLHIFLPAMYQIIVLVSLMSTAAMFQLFYWIDFLAPFPYAGSLMWRMYKTAFTFSRYGRGSAYAVVLMIIILAVAMVQRAVMRREK